MSDQERREPGEPQGAENESEEQRSARQPEEGGTEAERTAPHWWELRPDPNAYADEQGASAGGSGKSGAEQIVTGAWGEGKTVADAQLLQASAQSAAGREEPTSAPLAGTAATAANPGAAGSDGGLASGAGGAPHGGSGASGAGAAANDGGLGERLSGSAAGGRMASIARRTNETEIALTFSVDGSGRSEIETDVPFLNHMLDLFTKHGQFDLRVAARGDVDIDDHHTVEDIGICLGQTLREALGDKRGIKRYASVFVPMDEALAQVVIDISNRPHFEYRAQYPSAQVGSFQVELVHEFLWKLALEARITLHVIVHYGLNTHHMIEAVFKALGRAIDEATSIDPRVQGVPSTKGVL